MGALLIHTRTKAKLKEPLHSTYCKLLEQKYCDICQIPLINMKAVNQHRKSKHPELYEALTGIKAQPTNAQSAKTQSAIPRPSLTSAPPKRGPSSSTTLNSSANPASGRDDEIISQDTLELSSMIFSDSFYQIAPFNYPQGNWSPENLNIDTSATKHLKHNANCKSATDIRYATANVIALHESLPILNTQTPVYPHLAAPDKSAFVTENQPITHPGLNQDTQLVLDPISNSNHRSTSTTHCEDNVLYPSGLQSYPLLFK